MSTRDRARRERGAIAVLVAFMMIALGAFLALVINLGHAFDDKAQLQAASDSAALAGARSLNGTTAGASAAVTMAQTLMHRHTVDRETITTPATDYEYGCWNIDATPATKATAFQLYGSPGCSIRHVNAVRAKNGRDGTTGRNSAMPAAFGFFIGRSTVNITSEAVAIGGGPCESACTMPIVLAACQVESLLAGGCSTPLRFSDANVDTIGFTNLIADPGSGDRNVSTTTIIAAATCNGSPCCKNLAVSDLAVSNGNNLNCQVADAFKHYVGMTLSAPVLDIPCGTTKDGDPNPQFNQVHSIRGFLRFTVRAICGDNGSGKGGGKSCNYADSANTDPETGLPWACPGSGRAIVISVDCNYVDSGAETGCSSYGGVSPNVRLVR